MNTHSENESWVANLVDGILEKRALGDAAVLSDWERLFYCLWVTDYMLRNAGDFANAVVMYPKFQTDAQQLAERLSLTKTFEAFSLPAVELQHQYFDRFEAMCEEIKLAEPPIPPIGERA